MSRRPDDPPQPASRSEHPATVPAGWSSNPSAWSARLPIAALALAGAGISLYLALFQYHVLHDVWDPLCGDGSRKVLTSAISRALPVSDAALGAVAYLFETVVEITGGHRRWRDRPWLVLLLGLTAAALSVVGAILVVSQPLLTGTFCTLCLTSAAISFTVAALARHEVVATVAHLRRQHRNGRPLRQAIKGTG